jgi:hypothetical protein
MGDALLSRAAPGPDAIAALLRCHELELQAVLDALEPIHI